MKMPARHTGWPAASCPDSHTRHDCVTLLELLHCELNPRSESSFERSTILVYAETLWSFYRDLLMSLTERHSSRVQGLDLVFTLVFSCNLFWLQKKQKKQSKRNKNDDKSVCGDQRSEIRSRGPHQQG